MYGLIKACQRGFLYYFAYQPSVLVELRFHGRVDDVHECNEVARDAQLEAFFQRTEEWFDALSKQLTALAVRNRPQNCHPNPCYVKEEEDCDIEDDDEYIERVCVVN